MNHTLKVLAKISAALFLILCIFSCKKNDIEASTVQEQNFAERFFATKTAPSKEVAEVIEKLKQENERSGFVSKLPQNSGLPVWDKIAIQKYVVNDQRSYNRAKHGPSVDFELTEDSSENIIIPLSINNSNLSAVLIVEDLGNASIIDFYATNDYLYNVTHGAAVDTTNAMQQLALFFYMENRTFGTTKFYHIPPNLFTHATALDGDGNKTITIQDDTTTSNIVQNVWVCIEYVCSYCLGNDPNCPLGGHWTECTWIGGGGNPPTGGGGGGNPPGGGGGGSGNPGGGGNGGGPCPFTGGAWYNLVPEEGPCGPPPPPTTPPDTLTQQQILQLLKDENEAIKLKRDSIWNVAINRNWEYHFFTKKIGANFLVLGETTDSMENEITPNRIVEGNSNPDGEYHTHQDATPAQRHLHDPQDILNSSVLRRKLYYRNYVDCGDTLYVIVNENLNKIKQFAITAHLKTSQNSTAWLALANAGNNRRSLGISLLLSILGSSYDSGLGLYKSINASKTEFIKIN